MAKPPARRQTPALKVHQWLPGWDKIEFDPKAHRARPPQHFYVFSLPAQELRSLSGISRRQAANVTPRGEDLGIQRQHDPERSEEISKFVEYGYPWSTLSEAKRRQVEFNDLRKPGWLPTAIVVNLLKDGDTRRGAKVDKNDLVSIEDLGDIVSISLPYERWNKDWNPKSLPPIEVIDGQHRLWAFGRDGSTAKFEVPVVAFFGLDISWQAYLFWTINIKPKRINSSLAFDLYPLLRGEDWLDRAEGHPIYRETRAQELTEVLWSHPESPWYDRINMLGERQNEWVSQSAWIKSLISTFVKPWEGRGNSIGGLFGSRLKRDGEVLGWSRAQQAGFLVYSWQRLKQAVGKSRAEWATSLRAIENQKAPATQRKDDVAFYGDYSLIATDQGVRGILQVLNDLCFLQAANLKLDVWQVPGAASASDAEAVSASVKSLAGEPVGNFVTELAEGLAKFDWRTSSEPSLSDEQRREKLVFRGSSGYKELRLQLTEHLSRAAGEVGSVAQRMLPLIRK